ncbi:MAG: hypothetical protein J5I53_00655 [Bradyrhizobiaceae bacterium]|nr:hypothetical protein [Bradyrhizobiaceae bacterium]
MNKIQWSARSVLVVCILLVFGCADTQEVDNRLVAAYADVLVARYTLGDSTKVGSVFDSVATAHGYQPEEMRLKLRELASSYELMKKFYDSVSVRLDSMKKGAIDFDKR